MELPYRILRGQLKTFPFGKFKRTSSGVVHDSDCSHAVDDLQAGDGLLRTTDDTLTGTESAKSEKSIANAQRQEESFSKTDSRPVQGIEWLWFVIPVVLAGLPVWLVKRKKPP